MHIQSKLYVSLFLVTLTTFSLQHAAEQQARRKLTAAATFKSWSKIIKTQAQELLSAATNDEAPETMRELLVRSGGSMTVGLLEGSAAGYLLPNYSDRPQNDVVGILSLCAGSALVGDALWHAAIVPACLTVAYCQSLQRRR